jgi:ABC-type multidrug transport system fused ATPase/permease subunit
MRPQGVTRWLLAQLQPHARLVTFGLATAILAGSIGTVDPLLMRHLIDSAPAKHNLIESLPTVIFITLCFVGVSAFGGLGTLLSFRVAQLISQDLRVDLLEHMTSLSADWHERTFLGEKLSRIEQDVQQIAEFGSEAANSSLRTVIFFFVNLVIMFFLNWRITLSVMPLLPFFLWVRAHFRSRIRSYADQAQAGVGNASGVLAEHLGAVPQIQILGAENAQISRTVGAWIHMLAAQWKQRRTEVAFSISITTVLACGILIVLGFGFHEFLLGVLSLGGLVAFYAYVTRIFGPISTAMELYSRTQRVSASIRRVREVLETSSSVPDVGELSTIALPLRFGLVCKNVSFAYSAKERALRDVSFHIDACERVALIGKSGSGKSTLSRLMARMSDPMSGQVILEDRTIADYTLRTLRKTICYVPQQPVLFSGTIRDNLLYANASATSDEIRDAVEVAQLAPLLARLPLGIDTILGPEAVGLSGGERQRLAIARGLLRNAPVLVLDESTSALDLPTEEAIFRAIANARPNQMLIVISHRLRSLTWVDRMILLDSGTVSAEGSHASLYRESALYRSLYEREGQTELDDSLQREAERPAVSLQLNETR